MILGDRLREFREGKNLSQGDIEKRTGLLRCYISRVENGYTVPNVATLEKMARALEIPLYRLFTDTEKPVPTPNLRREPEPRIGRKGLQELRAFAKAFSKMDARSISLLMTVASRMARKKRLHE